MKTFYFTWQTFLHPTNRLTLRVLLLRMAAVGALLAAGCAHRSPEPRLYVFACCGEGVADGTAAGRPVVYVDPVRIAPYLDRPHVMIRRSDTEVEARQFDRWGTPLEVAVQELLVCAIGRSRAESAVLPVRAGSPLRDAHRIHVEILRLDGVPGGTVQLVARWRSERPHDAAANDTPRIGRHAVPTDDASVDAYVRAVRDAVFALGEEIAAGIGAERGERAETGYAPRI